MSFGPDPEQLYRIVGPTGGGPMPLIVLLDGWIEGGDALAMIHSLIVEQADLTTVAEFDTGPVLDQRMHRPNLTLIDGVTQKLEWPATELAVGTDASGSPFLLLHGHEPDLHWKNFAKAVQLATDSVGVSRTVLIGAYPAPVPHTRPIRVSLTSNNPELTVGWKHTPGETTVLAGIHFAIAEELQNHGVDTIGLWAQVPYYVATHSFPHAACEILVTLGQAMNVNFDTSRLESAKADAVAEIAESVEANPSMQAIVGDLEQRFDAQNELDNTELPSGDELEQQVQTYLRNLDP